MKRLSPFVWLLGLILVIWLLLIYSRKADQKTVAVATTAAPSSALPRAPLARSGVLESVARPAMAVTENEPSPNHSSAEIPEPESSWAKEMRELKELAAKDPDAALARVATMADKHELKTAAVVVCGIVAEKDPAKAMTAAWEFELGKFVHEEAENTALETLGKQWADVDLTKALVWASALPADDEWRRDRIVKGIATAVARIAPEEAARLVAERINPESSVQTDAAIVVLREWAAHEYTGAMAWASLFPEGPLRERSIEELASVEPNHPPSGPKSN